MANRNGGTQNRPSYYSRLGRQFATERIFPIRHLVDEVSDWSESSGSHNELSPEETMFKEPTTSKKRKRGDEVYDAPPYPPVPPEDQIKKLPADKNLGGYTDDSTSCDDGHQRKRFFTQRSQLVPEKNGGEPGVLSGPTPPDFKVPLIQRCEDEPIHIPGAIQQYGALIVIKYDDEGRLVVRIASENARSILGYGIEALFALNSFEDIIPGHQTGDFSTRVDHVLAKGHDPSGNTDLDVFELSLKSVIPGRDIVSFWCAIHLSAGSHDLIICEFEAQTDLFFPGDPGRKTLPKKPTRTLDKYELHYGSKNTNTN